MIIFHPDLYLLSCKYISYSTFSDKRKNRMGIFMGQTPAYAQTDTFTRRDLHTHRHIVHAHIHASGTQSVCVCIRVSVCV